MNSKSRTASLLFLLSIIPFIGFAQKNQVSSLEIKNFNLISSSLTNATGEELSKPGYNPDVYWFPVQVPSTVLTGLVANHIYPDPYIGMNNMLIPDASDSFNLEYNLEQYSYLPNDPNPWKKPYWYRTSFLAPAGTGENHSELIFKGINYRAAVWLNGQEVADSSEMVGMFEEFRLDVTGLIRSGDINTLAVKIYPLDDPGLPATEQLKALGDFYANGGPTGDIGKNVTMLCSVGWDWMPPVRDRNMGIWLPVFLRTTGPATIDHPKLITDLPDLPDTGVAKISLDIPVTNHSSSSVKGKINIHIKPKTFEGETIEFSKDVTIRANTTQTVRLTSGNTKELTIRNPHLWWPAGYGKPDLYQIRIEIETGDVISDVSSFAFGIRTVSSQAVPVRQSLRRDFYVNGKRIFLLGGAWVPDMMVNRDSVRYDRELRLCRDANLNLLRIWGGGITPPDAFFDLADKYGLLVWSDFWVTGDTQGEFRGSTGWPLQGDVFKKNVTSTILRIRNHPSLLLWTGGNEGHSRKELYTAMRDSLISLDGTRPFISCSSGYAHLPEGWKGSWPDDKAPGVYSGGPYSWQDPAKYYQLADHAKDWVFKDETGIPSQPPYSIMPKIIPDLVWDKTLPFPLNNTWGYHDAATGNGKFDLYYQDMVQRFGKPESMKAYCDKMQLMNAMGYQGIFEAAEHNLNETGGIMLWKLNAAFPSVIWQIYDWYLMPNAGYYFIQNSCNPVHVQFNRDDSTVVIINRTYREIPGLTVNADVYNADSKVLFHVSRNEKVTASSVQKSFSLAGIIKRTGEMCFVVLNLRDQDGKVISRNTYWLSPDQNFDALNTMSESDVDVQILDTERGIHDLTVKMKFTNTTDKLAFFINPQLTMNGEEILPSFWSANYFTLKPEESIEVRVNAPVENISGHNLIMKVQGWNIHNREITLE